MLCHSDQLALLSISASSPGEGQTKSGKTTGKGSRGSDRGGRSAHSVSFSRSVHQEGSWEAEMFLMCLDFRAS